MEEIHAENEIRRQKIMQDYLAKKAVREEIRNKLYARRLSVA